MTANELIKIGQTLYGRRKGWQMAMADALGVDASTIRRWISADSVPGPAAAALRSFNKQIRPAKIHNREAGMFITVGHASV